MEFIRKRFVGLWRNSDFMKLWGAETASQIGSHVTLVALPLAAVLVLDASAAEMGLLGAIQFAPFLLFGLIAGVWVDRLHRRPILIITDVGRAVLLSSIPIAAFFDILTIYQLYVVGFLVGTLTLFFDVSYQSYLPSLLNRDELTEGNSKLEVSTSLAQIAGPSIGGILVDLVTAPIAILIDALSFLFSAILLGRIKTNEILPQSEAEKGKNLRSEVSEGLRFVFGSDLLRAIAACTATSNLFGRILFTVFLLYLTRDLNISATSIGLIFAMGSVGAFLGAMSTSSLNRHINLGKMLIISIFVGNAGLLLTPLAGISSANLAIPVLMLSQFIWGFATPIYNINQVSMRQAYTPDNLQGRMNASMRTVIWGTVPIGYLIGGALGESIGLLPTLFVGAIGGLLSVIWLLFSPIVSLRDVKSLGAATD